MTDKQPYAELPDWDSGDEPIWEAIFQWKDAKQGIEAHKKSLAVEQAIVGAMRDFADATHALRAALAAQAPHSRYGSADMQAMIVARAAEKDCAAQAPQFDHRAVHLHHCNIGEHVGSCKYGDDECPALRKAAPQQAALGMPSEIALMEKAARRVGITSLLNHGAASCVYSEGCAGVSQEHLLAYTREIALHCAVALAAPEQAAPNAPDELMRDLKNALDLATELRQQLTLMEEHARGEVWLWQADGADNLATMGNRMGVLIYASDLRKHFEAAPQQAAPAVGNSGFDHKTAADFLSGKTVSDEAMRKFVAASRWAHDDRVGLQATLQVARKEIASREAEIALLKQALLDAEAAPQQEVQSVDDLAKELDTVREALQWYVRRCDHLQRAQHRMRDPERTIVCDILANGSLLVPEGQRYAAQPAPSGDAEDAQRWRTFIGLPYAIRSEWACNLSMAPVLTQWVDAARKEGDKP